VSIPFSADYQVIAFQHLIGLHHSLTLHQFHARVGDGRRHHFHRSMVAQPQEHSRE
jgi:hypothetical protein